MSDTQAIDHRVVLKPIKVKPISRPAFDNTHLGQQRSWTQDNSTALARYFHQLGARAGETSQADLMLWLSCQHELEITYQARARLPHTTAEAL
jgi:hypothetical protein